MPTRRRTPPPADGAFLEVDGRRWRRSDPKIPAALRQQLVNELMSARRAVAAAAADSERRVARARVQDAKVALGERGRAWWLDGSPGDLEPRILRNRQPAAGDRTTGVLRYRLASAKGPG
jgi:hypothetical protein